MKLCRALSDLVKYTKSVGVHDIETQGGFMEQSWTSLILVTVFSIEEPLLKCDFHTDFKMNTKSKLSVRVLLF